MKYWITVISEDHVKKGMSEGFMQACHGKSSPLKKMSEGDYVIFYSPKKEISGKDKLQNFTAIGKVKDKDIYEFKMSEDFIPFRRNIEYLDCKNIPIKNMIGDLEFIKNKEKWGFIFMTGFFEINEHDFKLISEKMLNKSVP